MSFFVFLLNYSNIKLDMAWLYLISLLRRAKSLGEDSGENGSSRPSQRYCQEGTYVVSTGRIDYNWRDKVNLKMKDDSGELELISVGIHRLEESYFYSLLLLLCCLLLIRILPLCFSCLFDVYVYTPLYSTGFICFFSSDLFFLLISSPTSSSSSQLLWCPSSRLISSRRLSRLGLKDLGPNIPDELSTVKTVAHRVVIGQDKRYYANTTSCSSILSASCFWCQVYLEIFCHHLPWFLWQRDSHFISIPHFHIKFSSLRSLMLTPISQYFWITKDLNFLFIHNYTLSKSCLLDFFCRDSFCVKFRNYLSIHVSIYVSMYLSISTNIYSSVHLYFQLCKQTSVQKC